MNRRRVADVPSDCDERGVERRRLADALGTTGVALTRYRVAPGAGLPAGLHAHADQEEVFHVQHGTGTFDVLLRRSTDGDESSEGGGSRGDESDGSGGDEYAVRTLAVDAGEAVRFAPGEFQSGRNAGDADLVVLAVGAPRDGADLRFPVACPDCDGGELRLATDGGPRFVCPACGADSVPTPCPDCGGDDLRVRLDAAARSGETVRAAVRDPPTVVACRDCAATFETPPVEGSR